MVNLIELSASMINTSEYIEISFKVEDSFEDMNDYQFDLYRSSFEEGEYSLVYSDIRNFGCCDYSANTYNFEINYNYKIKIINRKTGEYKYTEPFAGHYIKKDNYMTALGEIYDKYLDVIGNSEFVLLKRIREGTMCDCYDDVRGSSRRGQHCLKCYGTGYVNGYYKPIKIKVNLQNSATITENMTHQGTFEKSSPVQLWTGSYPLIQEGDVLVNTLLAERSTIMTCQPSYKNGVLIRQTMQIATIPKSNIIYKVPINL